MSSSDEDTDVADAAPLGPVSNRRHEHGVDSFANRPAINGSAAPISFSSTTNEGRGSFGSPGSIGQGPDFSSRHENSNSLPSDTSIQSGLSIANPSSISSAFSSEGGSGPPSYLSHVGPPNERQGAFHDVIPRPQLPASRHQQPNSTLVTSQTRHQARRQDDNVVSYRLPPPLRSPPSEPRRPTRAPRSHPNESSYGASPASSARLASSSNCVRYEDHNGCSQECRMHAYNAVLHHAAEDLDLATEIQQQLEQLSVHGRGVRVSLLSSIRPTSTRGRAFQTIVEDRCTTVILILRTARYLMNENSTELGSHMISFATENRSLDVVQIICDEPQEKACLTRCIVYENSKKFSNQMIEVLQGTGGFGDQQSKHDKIRAECEARRRNGNGQPNGDYIKEPHSLTAAKEQHPQKTNGKTRRSTKSKKYKKPDGNNRLSVEKTYKNFLEKDSSSATSSSGHKGDVSNSSEREPSSSEGTAGESLLSHVIQQTSSKPYASNETGNDSEAVQNSQRPREGSENVKTPECHDEEENLSESDNFCQLQRDNGESSDSRSGNASNTKEVIRHMNTTSCSQTSDSPSSDESQPLRPKTSKRLNDHVHRTPESHAQKKLGTSNCPTKNKFSSSQDTSSDSRSSLISSCNLFDKADSEEMDEPNERCGDVIATQSRLENVSDQQQNRTQESMTDLPSSNLSPCRQRPCARVSPTVKQSHEHERKLYNSHQQHTESLTVIQSAEESSDDEDTEPKTIWTQQQHETETNLDQQPTASPTIPPAVQQTSLNPRRHDTDTAQHRTSTQQVVPSSRQTFGSESSPSSEQHTVSPQQTPARPRELNISPQQDPVADNPQPISPGPQEDRPQTASPQGERLIDESIRTTRLRNLENGGISCDDAISSDPQANGCATTCKKRQPGRWNRIRSLMCCGRAEKRRKKPKR